MTDLSAANMTVSRGFVYTGLDYCGLFDVKKLTARSKQIKKSFYLYLCEFYNKVFEIASDSISAVVFNKCFNKCSGECSA